MNRLFTGCCCVALVCCTLSVLPGCGGEASTPSADDVTNFLEDNPDIAAESAAAAAAELEERETDIATPK